MGMYSDNIAPNRLKWTYKYTGAQLLPYAVKMHKEMYAKEEAARKSVSRLMADMSISHNDTKINEAKQDISNYGTLREQCSVFEMEFARNPEQVFDLGLGDITFFGMNNSHE